MVKRDEFLQLVDSCTEEELCQFIKKVSPVSMSLLQLIY